MRAAVVCVALALASGGARADDERDALPPTVPSSEEGDARLRQAEVLAKKQEVESATDLYRALLAEGRDGKDLRYNLGTLCLELGDIGCAILHLRAASRMDPLDDDVQHNLEVALEARTDRLAGSPVIDPFHFVGARVPPLAARAALALPLALLGLAFVVAAFVHGRVRAVARTAAMLGAVTSMIGGAVYASRVFLEKTVEAVVVVPETPALKEPDAGAAVAFTAHAGLHGDVVGHSLDGGDLVRLRFENGLEAWVKASHTAAVIASGRTHR